MLIIGDVHGKYESYLKLTQKNDYTLQIGDFSFNYDFLKEVDSNKNKFFYGNHDGYHLFNQTIQSGHNLGHFGLRKHGGVDFFFIRGGCSIDKQCRTLGFDWFPEEELDVRQQMQCEDEYAKVKPDIVFSHECPSSIERKLFTNRTLCRYYGYPDEWNSSTSHLLENCLREYRPKLWVHGHFHQKRDAIIEGTRFICLPELGTFTLE